MRIIEILLPKGTSDRSLSPQVIRKINDLQTRMDQYVDKILSPNTSPQGKEFLKSRLRDDYFELRNTIPGMHAVAENSAPQKYEVYDIKTKEVVSGPYSTIRRARLARDKKDIEYGAYKYGVRPKAETKSIYEAVHKLPITHKDFELVKELMEKPIPAVIAPIYISEIIDDDDFNGQLYSLEETNPGMDIRPLIVEWLKRVMPDQMYRFIGGLPDSAQKNGVLSPIHGYDSHQYKGTNDPITGDAYGSF